MIKANNVFCQSGLSTTSRECHASGFTWVDAKIELFPIVQPHFSKPSIIVVDDFGGAAWKGVGGRLPEHVAHVGTCGDHKLTTAHPYLYTKRCQDKVSYLIRSSKT